MSGQQPITAVGGVKQLTPAEHESAVSDLKNGELVISQGDDPTVHAPQGEAICYPRLPREDTERGRQGRGLDARR